MKRKTKLLLLITCLIIVMLCTLPFIESNWIRAVSALAFGFPLSRALHKWLNSKQLSFIREQFKWLLEHLLSRLSAGATLEHAFIEAPASLGLLLGRKSDLLAQLKRIESQLISRQPLNLLLPELIHHLPCPEAQSCFQILPALRQSGGDICQYIRQQLHLIVEQLALIRDLNAETTQRQTEALILTAMPFGLVILLRQSSDMFLLSSSSTVLGTAAMLAAFSLAMTAAVTTLSSIGFTNLRRKSKSLQISSSARKRPELIKLIGSLSHQFYRNLLPEIYGARLLQFLQEQSKYLKLTSAQIMQTYFESKVIYFFAGLLTGILFLVAWPGQFFWPLVCSLGFVLLQDQQVFSLSKSQQLECQLDYPAFLGLVAALLQAGVSLYIALDICLKSLQNTSAEITQMMIGKSIQNDLADLGRKIRIGVPAYQAIEKLAVECPITEVQSALLLIVRYDRDGGNENLQLLQMQIAACWSMHRNSMQKQIEKQTLKLLVPMALDLVAVMIIAVAPAIQSFQSI